MNKAKIYFNGQIVYTVLFEKIESQENNTILTHGFGDNKKIVAIVPTSHLIISD